MTLLDKSDKDEQTAHVGRTDVGTILPGRLQPIRPPEPYAYVPTKVEPRRDNPTYTFWDLPNDTFPTGEVVYFVYCAGRIKIGLTVGLTERLLQLSAGSPFMSIAILLIRGSRKDEKALHERFADARLHGEWFAISDDLRRFLRQRLCEVGRASLEKAEAEYRDHCAGIVAAHKPLGKPLVLPRKDRPKPLCAHGTPLTRVCGYCDYLRDMATVERINAGTYSQ